MRLFPGRVFGLKISILDEEQYIQTNLLQEEICCSSFNQCCFLINFSNEEVSSFCQNFSHISFMAAIYSFQKRVFQGKVLSDELEDSDERFPKELHKTANLQQNALNCKARNSSQKIEKLETFPKWIIWE